VPAAAALQIDSELSREEEVSTHCKDAFEAVAHFEGTYNLKVQVSWAGWARQG
jgi:hypothetical protein